MIRHLFFGAALHVNDTGGCRGSLGFQTGNETFGWNVPGQKPLKAKQSHSAIGGNECIVLLMHEWN